MSNESRVATPYEVAGLIPAAGKALRVSPLPCSKEIFPIGFHTTERDGELRPKAVCHYLLERMAVAGITTCYVVLGDEKWDIPSYLGDGRMVGVDLAYLVRKNSPGTPYTVDAAFPFLRGKIVALGFPDILIRKTDIFVRLIQYQRSTDADVVIGLFPAEQPMLVDMVQREEDGGVKQIVIKPKTTALTETWGVAVWTPAFTEYLHDVLSRRTTGREAQELFIGDIIQAAINDKMRVVGLSVSDEPYLDIGTPQNLIKAVRNYSE